MFKLAKCICLFKGKMSQKGTQVWIRTLSVYWIELFCKLENFNWQGLKKGANDILSWRGAAVIGSPLTVPTVFHAGPGPIKIGVAPLTAVGPYNCHHPPYYSFGPGKHIKPHTDTLWQKRLIQGVENTCSRSSYTKVSYDLDSQQVLMVK